MSKLTIDCKGEQINPMILPEDWYAVVVEEVPTLETGKKSGKKYLLWKVKVATGEFEGFQVRMNTTLDRGDDLTKSSRWLFHQAMASCGIKKINDKYSFELAELKGKEFWIKLSVKEDSYNGNVFEKNEVRQIAIEPSKPKEKSIIISDSIENEEDKIPF